MSDDVADAKSRKAVALGQRAHHREVRILREELHRRIVLRHKVAVGLIDYDRDVLLERAFDDLFDVFYVYALTCRIVRIVDVYEVVGLGRHRREREGVRDVVHRDELGSVELVVVFLLELVRRVVYAQHLGVHVVIGKLRRDAQHDRIVCVKDVVDYVQRVDAAVRQQNVVALNVDLVLPEFAYRVIQSVAVRVRSEPGRIELL